MANSYPCIVAVLFRGDVLEEEAVQYCQMKVEVLNSNPPLLVDRTVVAPEPHHENVHHYAAVPDKGLEVYESVAVSRLSSDTSPESPVIAVSTKSLPHSRHRGSWTRVESGCPALYIASCKVCGRVSFEGNPQYVDGLRTGS